MWRWVFGITCFYFLISVSAAFAEPVTLRSRIEANGAQITLGDVFLGAGDAANRAIGPAPAPGQIANLPMPLLTALASAAGLEFTPPAGVHEVRVVRPGGMRATLPPSSGESAVSAGPALAASEIVIRRGEAVTLVYQAPGVTLTTRARALENGAVGQSVRLLNVTSNRNIEAIVTGPGAARAETP
jgi:flagellar basal body P-ring formation protein FlgA